MNQTVAILNDVDTILSDRSRWIKHALARDSQGVTVGVTNLEACKFCLSGAVYSAALHRGRKADSAMEALYDAIKILYVHGSNVPAFNDAPTTKFEDVKAVIAYAKALAVSR